MVAAFSRLDPGATDYRISTLWYRSFLALKFIAWSWS